MHAAEIVLLVAAGFVLLTGIDGIQDGYHLLFLLCALWVALEMLELLGIK